MCSVPAAEAGLRCSKGTEREKAEMRKWWHLAEKPRLGTPHIPV